MKKVELSKLENIKGGYQSCDTKLAAVAAGAAFVGIFFPPADIVAGAALSAWMSKCL